MNIYNHMQSWIYASKELSLYSKFILQRLVSLSKDGEQKIFCSRESLNQDLGLPLRTITKGFKELLDKGFIEILDNPNKFSRKRFFKVTSKTLSENPSTVCQIDLAQNAHDPSTVCQIDLAQNAHDPSTVCHSILAPCATSSLDRSIGRYKGDRSVVDPTEESARERTDSTISKMETVNEYDPMDELPPPDDFIPPNYAYNAQNASNSPQMSNYTSETKIAPPERYTNEIEGYRDTSPHQPEQTERTPQTADEIVPLIERFKEAHRNEKVFEKIDVSFYAGKIFDYYVKEDGMWRDRNNNPIPAFKIYNKISMWITNDQRSGKLCLIQNKTQQQSVEDSERELRDFANRLEVAAGRMTPEEYRRRSVGNASYTVIDQDSIIDKMPLLATATRSKP